METAIITVRTPGGKFEKDMELPTNLSVRDLSAKLYDIVLMVDPLSVRGIRQPKLFAGRQQNTPLEDALNLDEQGIFDGAVITIGGKKE